MTFNLPFKYRPRLFKSRGAALVLVWSFLIYYSLGSTTGDFEELSNILLDRNYEYSTQYLYLQYIVPNLFWIVAALGTGLLADGFVKRYKVVRAGIFIAWAGKALGCLTDTLLDVTGIDDVYYSTPLIILFILGKSLRYFAIATIAVNTIQLGLDQLIDNTTEHITSFISLFILAINGGGWFNHVTYNVMSSCVFAAHIREFKLVWWLVQVFILTTVLCSDVALSHKWLRDEPRVPQSFKRIVEVLKFAVKHKRLIQRSAFTYWEDKIPSRIDLGKNKYGGPFTTEQVENVKTVLRIFGLSIALAFSTAIFFSFVYYVDYLFTLPNVNGLSFRKLQNLTECQQTFLQVTATFRSFWVVAGIVVYELFIYPIIRHRVPGMLKRIGFVIVMSAPYMLLYLIPFVVFYKMEGTVTLTWVKIPNSFWLAVRTILITTAPLEFFYAQVPQKMRGLAIGYLWFILAFFSRLPVFFFIIYVTKCSQKYCQIVYCSVTIFLSVVISIAFVRLANRYVKRERDERIDQQRIVEDTYSHYVECDPKRNWREISINQ